jgi:hypothetical protein
MSRARDAKAESPNPSDTIFNPATGITVWQYWKVLPGRHGTSA